jgi:hypothetical protein
MLLIWQEPLLNRVLLFYSDIVPSIWDHRTRYWCRQPSHFVSTILQNLTHYYSWGTRTYVPSSVRTFQNKFLPPDRSAKSPANSTRFTKLSEAGPARTVLYSNSAPFLCLDSPWIFTWLELSSRMKSPYTSSCHYHSSLWAEHPDPVLYRKSRTLADKVRRRIYISRRSPSLRPELISPVSRSSGPYPKVLVSSTRGV